MNKIEKIFFSIIALALIGSIVLIRLNHVAYAIVLFAFTVGAFYFFAEASFFEENSYVLKVFNKLMLRLGYVKKDSSI